MTEHGLNFYYYQFKDLHIWNSRKIVDTHMPKDFQKKFQKQESSLMDQKSP